MSIFPILYEYIICVYNFLANFSMKCEREVYFEMLLL